MKILKGEAWGIVTARGGSKSIPLKNLVPVCGRPLVAYVIEAACQAATVNRVICSTDHDKIADTSKDCGAEVLMRPEDLSGDLANSIDVVIHVAETMAEKEGAVAEILVLLQPTSLFLTSGQIDDAVSALLNDPAAKSSQTVIEVPHQFHAYNQRRMAEDGRDIGFEFAEERKKGHNKQTKPKFYCYGNLIVTRTEPLIKEKTLFAHPSIPVVIPREYAYDLDGPDDIAMAELMIQRNLVAL